MQTVYLAVDVQGGDYGPRVIIDGILKAQKESNTPLVVYLCGIKTDILSIIDSNGCNDRLRNKELIIENCPQVIDIYEVPSRVWKNKKYSSLVRCISLQKEGIVHASLSAGDTRIIISAAIFLLGRVREVIRPALAAFLPTIISQPSLLLDVGANLNCRVEHLVTFGLMGYEYVKKYFLIKNPSVALLNVGEESSKGTKTIVEASIILSSKCKGYCGYIEGGRLLSGDANVIICDGFLGNVLLKTCESFHTLIESVLKGNQKLIKLLIKNMTILNPENYGAVPLLGLKGVVLKAHGSSSSKAIAQAIFTAVRTIEKKVFINNKVL